jgi:hypothetical protein
VPIDTDHSGIVKFTDRADRNYMNVVQRLKEYVNKAADTVRKRLENTAASTISSRPRNSKIPLQLHLKSTTYSLVLLDLFSSQLSLGAGGTIKQNIRIALEFGIVITRNCSMFKLSTRQDSGISLAHFPFTPLSLSLLMWPTSFRFMMCILNNLPGF